MLQANYKGSIGQAFTTVVVSFSATIEAVFEMDFDNDFRNRGIFISTINAVLRYLNLSTSSVHC